MQAAEEAAVADKAEQVAKAKRAELEQKREARLAETARRQRQQEEQVGLGHARIWLSLQRGCLQCRHASAVSKQAAALIQSQSLVHFWHLVALIISCPMHLAVGLSSTRPGEFVALYLNYCRRQPQDLRQTADLQAVPLVC